MFRVMQRRTTAIWAWLFYNTFNCQTDAFIQTASDKKCHLKLEHKNGSTGMSTIHDTLSPRNAISMDP